MLEIWKDIKDYEGLYQISNFGNIKRLEHIVFRKNPKNNKIKTGYKYKERLLSLKNDKDGYKIIVLCKDNKVKNFRIHRLVAKTFISNPNNFKIVNHIDAIKSNNHFTNLEWCTIKYNTNYGDSLYKRAVTQGKPIYYQKDDKIICYYSIGYAAKCNNVNTSYIYRLVNNIGNNPEKRYWHYAKEER